MNSVNESAAADMLAALQAVAASVCSYTCPSTRPAGEPWPHSEQCRALTDAVSKALGQNVTNSPNHGLSIGGES